MISDLKRNFAEPDSAVGGAEFVGTSLSGGGDSGKETVDRVWGPLKADNPHWKMIDTHRGYHLFAVRRGAVEAEVRVPGTVLQPESPSRAPARFRVVNGVPGVRREA